MRDKKEDEDKQTKIPNIGYSLKNSLKITRFLPLAKNLIICGHQSEVCHKQCVECNSSKC